MSAVIVIRETGEIAAIESYDSTNDSSRTARIAAAAAACAVRVGTTCTVVHAGRRFSAVDAAGNEWGILADESSVEVGMVEVAPGRWGFST